MNIRKMPTIPTLPKKKQVAAYARVSSGKDAIQDVSSAAPEPEEDDGVVVAQSEDETLNSAPAPVVSDHTSTGFVIGRETPDAVLSEDGEHIDLYAMAALNWRATQELLDRIEQLEEKI